MKTKGFNDMDATLSIITINLNNREGLRRTLGSVFDKQSGFSDFEEIVIDGGSTDGSVDVIHPYADRLGYWVTEPDKGIFNAMNKGIGQAHGKYLLFLNSGDELHNDILPLIFSSTHSADIVYGNVDLYDANVHTYTKTPPPAQDIKPWFFLYDSLPHPGSFISSSLFSRNRRYDENLKISSDCKFFFETIILDCASLEYIPVSITKMDASGISNQPKTLGLRIQEVETFLVPYFGKSIFEYVKCGLFNNTHLRKSHLNVLLRSPETTEYLLRFNDLFFFLIRTRIGRFFIKFSTQIMQANENRILRKLKRKRLLGH